MAAFSKVDAFVLELGLATHNLNTGVLKVALSATAPTSASTLWNTTNFPAPAAANGYTAGGNTLTGVSYTQSGTSGKLVASDSVFTATAGGIGPFQYVILYNSSAPASGKIIGYYNYGSVITLLADTETFTVDFDPTNGVLTVT